MFVAGKVLINLPVSSVVFVAGEVLEKLTRVLCCVCCR